MALKPPLVSNNPLVRHVQRHRRMATLFREAPETVTPSQSRTLQWDGEPDAAIPVVPAYLVDTGPLPLPLPDTPRPTVPAGRIQPRPPAPRATDAAQRTPDTSTRQPEATDVRATTETRTSREIPINPKTDVTTPTAATDETTHPVSSAAAAAESSPDTEDTTITHTVWRRLKTIFQRHQEKETASQSPEAAAPDAAAPSTAEPDAATPDTAAG